MAEGDTVRLYVDSDDQSYDGKVVASISATTGYYHLSVQTLTPLCTFYVYGAFHGDGTIQEDYAENKIDNPLTTLPGPSNAWVRFTEDSIRISWLRDPSPGITEYIIRVHLGGDITEEFTVEGDLNLAVLGDDFENAAGWDLFSKDSLGSFSCPLEVLRDTCRSEALDISVTHASCYGSADGQIYIDDIGENDQLKWETGDSLAQLDSQFSPSTKKVFV